MNETKTALANVEQPKPSAAIAPLRAGRPAITVDTLVAEGEQRKLLMQYVAAHMREGSDYGVIPGTGKKDAAGNDTGNKSLLKPGAEKLVDLFRCVPEFEIVKSEIDWDKPLFHYLFRCRILTLEGGAIVAEGFGSANSHESKYRYRNEDRKCPACGKAAIKKSKYPPRESPDDPPGFYCFAKAGGCGANYEHNDDAITSQPIGKVENMDAADCDNTILKMAKKRALVDAAIALVRCSDMFTQDMEDEPHDVPTRSAPAKDAKPKPESKPDPERPTPSKPFEDHMADIREAETYELCKAAVQLFSLDNRRKCFTGTQERAALDLAASRKAKFERAANSAGSKGQSEPGADEPDDGGDISF